MKLSVDLKYCYGIKDFQHDFRMVNIPMFVEYFIMLKQNNWFKKV